MSTQSSNSTASPAGVSIRENSHVARIKRVYTVIPVGTSVAASNDLLYQAPKETAGALDAWARRAAAANGFGDAPTTDMPAKQSGVRELPARARYAAQAGLGEILAAMAEAFASQVHSISAAWQRARDARATRHALEGLDARTLRDIGFDRSEAPSIAAELAGDATLTRIRTLMALRDLPV